MTAVLALLVLLSCGAGTVTRAEWQRMSREDRVLYVSSLIGEEKAKDAKGGRGATVVLPVEEYVDRIDQAYARGDAREAHHIFAELAR